MNMDSDATGGFEKLQFLLQQTPCPPGTPSADSPFMLGHLCPHIQLAVLSIAVVVYSIAILVFVYFYLKREKERGYSICRRPGRLYRDIQQSSSALLQA